MRTGGDAESAGGTLLGILRGLQGKRSAERAPVGNVVGGQRRSAPRSRAIQEAPLPDVSLTSMQPTRYLKTTRGGGVHPSAMITCRVVLYNPGGAFLTQESK